MADLSYSISLTEINIRFWNNYKKFKSKSYKLIIKNCINWIKSISFKMVSLTWVRALTSGLLRLGLKEKCLIWSILPKLTGLLPEESMILVNIWLCLGLYNSRRRSNRNLEIWQRQWEDWVLRRGKRLYVKNIIQKILSILTLLSSLGLTIVLQELSSIF